MEDCDNTAAPGESPQGGMTDDGGNTNAQEGDQQPPTSNSEPNNAEDFSAILGGIFFCGISFFILLHLLLLVFTLLWIMNDDGVFENMV